MANMGDHGQAHGLITQLLGRGRAAYSATVFLTRMFANQPFSIRRTAGKQGAHPSRKPLDIVAVELRLTGGSALLATGSHVAVGETVGFGLGKGSLLDQDPLPLVAVSSPTPLQHKRA
jgi:hypothetical protein